MVSVFLQAYIAAQLEDRAVAKAVYRVVLDLGAGAIPAQERTLAVAAIAAMLRTAPELSAGDIEMIAFTFFLLPFQVQRARGAQNLGRGKFYFKLGAAP